MTAEKRDNGAWLFAPEPPACPLCGNERYIEDPELHGYRPCECHARVETWRAMRRSNVPSEFHGAMLSQFETPFPEYEAAKRAVAAWARHWSISGPCNSLLLWGTTGDGKTMVAVAMLKYLATVCPNKPRELIAHFANYCDLIDDLHASMDRRNDAEDDSSVGSQRSILWPCKRARILLLDDLGTGASSEWRDERLYGVINERHRERLPMIVTMNFAPTQRDAEQFNADAERLAGERAEERPRKVLALEERVDPRILSRLLDMCEVVRMPTRDWRRR